jgi:transposase-like protein
VGVKRKQHSAEFKARVAMAALSGEKTLALKAFPEAAYREIVASLS